MLSIQAYLLKSYYRLQQRLSPPRRELDLVKERAELEAIAKMFKPPVDFKVSPVEVEGIKAEWITPSDVTGEKIVLYLHGGYYLIGSIQTHRTLAGNIAIAAQSRALIIEYRLAPEHPFPAALEDAEKAYSWLLASGARPEQIILAGDSAGGGLVLATLLVLRDEGKPLPASAVCLSPATDLTMTSESWIINLKKEFVVNPYTARQIQPLYLKEIPATNPLASPIYGDLHGLPPLLIQVGSEEALLCDSTGFAERARAAGVDVTLEVWPGMFHVWQATAPMIPEARQAIDRIGEFIKTVSMRNESPAQ